MFAKDEKKRQNNFLDICSRCKVNYSCCHGTRPPISNERRKIIEKYLKEKRIPREDPFVQEEYTFPRENRSGYCTFFDKKTKRCLIHPVKPETCVAGPVTFDISTQGRKIKWYIKMERICPLARIVYEDKELLQKHLESAKKEISRLVNRLGSEELRVILKKEEPETFKIDEDAVKRNVLSKLTCGD